MSEKPLAGAIAVVTGVGREVGIGAAICRALARDGADVFLTAYRVYDRAIHSDDSASWPAPLLRELQSMSVYANYAEVDLSAPDAAPALFDAVEEWLGVPTILVNNAAYSTDSDWQTLDAGVLDRHYAVNVRATALLSVEFARRFSRGDGGRIINLSSGQSLGPMPSELAYAATKGAVEALTVSLSPDLMARGITVNAVNPGPTDTGWMSPALQARLRKQFPGGRLGKPDDIARLVAFLAGPESGWITGQVIHSEGGFLRG